MPTKSTSSPAAITSGMLCRAPHRALRVVGRAGNLEHGTAVSLAMRRLVLLVAVLGMSAARRLPPRHRALPRLPCGWMRSATSFRPWWTRKHGRPFRETLQTAGGRTGFGVPDHPDDAARVRYRRARGAGSGLRSRERDRLWGEAERWNLSGEGAVGRRIRLSRPRADPRTPARRTGGFLPNSRRVTELRFELDTRVRAGASDQGWRYLPSPSRRRAGLLRTSDRWPGWTTTIVMRALGLSGVNSLS